MWENENQNSFILEYFLLTESNDSLWFFELFLSMQTNTDVSAFLTVKLICVSDILYDWSYYYEKRKWMQEPQLLFMQTISDTPTLEHDRRRNKGRVMGSTHLKQQLLLLTK